jgi:Zn-finger nucleic acid-binding protein
MEPETQGAVTVDRCVRCNALWFDARELDSALQDLYAPDGPGPEARIPKRGISSRRCPRCDILLESAGWTGLILDRCPTCRGLFVEVHDLAQLQREQVPLSAMDFGARLQSAMVSGGWALLTAKGIVNIIIRFLR